MEEADNEGERSDMIAAFRKAGYNYVTTILTDDQGVAHSLINGKYERVLERSDALWAM
jgi:hypothetical protein